MINIPFFLTLYAGFTHAFEVDHILAVSNMITNRNKTIKAIKDGMFWGFGHTSTILFVGIIFLILKFEITPEIFKYFEAAVGCMLTGLGVYRIYKWYSTKSANSKSYQQILSNEHEHPHKHTTNNTTKKYTHLPAYFIGLVHGLAGSGSLILIVLSKSQSVANGLLYLLLFGLGSVIGMMLAAGAFNMPFSKKIFANKILQNVLISLSAVLCIGYGIVVIKQNLF
jgi:high-affinity nickel permease